MRVVRRRNDAHLQVSLSSAANRATIFVSVPQITRHLYHYLHTRWADFLFVYYYFFNYQSSFPPAIVFPLVTPERASSTCPPTHPSYLPTARGVGNHDTRCCLLTHVFTSNRYTERDSKATSPPALAQMENDIIDDDKDNYSDDTSSLAPDGSVVSTVADRHGFFGGTQYLSES